MRPATGRIDRAVGHAAVQVVGEIQLHVVLRGGRVLVEAVCRESPGDARLGCSDSVAYRVVGVGVRIGGVHIRRRARQFRAVIVDIGDGVGIGVRAAGTGHRRAPPDGVVDIAVGGYRPVLNLRD